MWPPVLNLALGVGGISFGGSFSLEPLIHAFEYLVETNEESRERDAVPEKRNYVRVRMQCPSCGAPIFHLTSFVRGGKTHRACRKCSHTFPTAS